MHKVVDGVEVPLSAEEIAEIEARDAEWEAGQAERDKQAHNEPILAALAALDAKTVRPLRAILAAGGSPDPADVQALADLRAQADALRAQLIR